MRRRNVKNAKERLASHDGLMVFDAFSKRGHWADEFGNNNPIYLEIGMGKGKFLLEHARQNPHINYIGIEKFDSVIVQATEKIAEAGLVNIRLINIDAEKLMDCFAMREINKIFLNFSDPWPKKRHEKRRLTSNTFLRLYEQIIRKDGDIEIKTDNEPFFTYSIMSINNAGYQILDLTFNLHSRDEEIITTEYEDRFSQKGNPIFYMKIKK